MECFSQLIKKELLLIDTLKDINFSVEFAQYQNSLTYKSSCCLLLAQNDKNLSLKVFAKIINHFDNSPFRDTIEITINDRHWLEFRVDDRLLNDWLNKFSNIRLINQKNNRNINYDFDNYYVFLRCSSLLKSAHEQKIITLSNLSFEVNRWDIKSPNFIDYQPLIQLKSYEKKLIEELIITREKISQNKLNYTRALNNLTTKILEVESHCRIWGNNLKTNLPISQARLGLIALSLYCYQNLCDFQ